MASDLFPAAASWSRTVAMVKAFGMLVLEYFSAVRSKNGYSAGEVRTIQKVVRYLPHDYSTEERPTLF